MLEEGFFDSGTQGSNATTNVKLGKILECLSFWLFLDEQNDG